MIFCTLPESLQTFFPESSRKTRRKQMQACRKRHVSCSEGLLCQPAGCMSAFGRSISNAGTNTKSAPQSLLLCKKSSRFRAFYLSISGFYR